MSKFIDLTKDQDLQMPQRATPLSAGYDVRAAEDTIIPSMWQTIEKISKMETPFETNLYTLEEQAAMVKRWGLKPTLVPVKFAIELADNEYCMFVPRSGVATKNMLHIPNSPSTIDADYIQSDNKGECFVPVYNLSPWNLVIKKGDRFAQAIISEYKITEDDAPLSVQRNGGFGSSGGK